MSEPEWDEFCMKAQRLVDKASWASVLVVQPFLAIYKEHGAIIAEASDFLPKEPKP